MIHCYCTARRWGHLASERCEAGKLASELDIDLETAAWYVSLHGTAENGAAAYREDGGTRRGNDYEPTEFVEAIRK